MPRVYIACLRAYNNGQLHGRWIDLDDSDADLNAETLTAGVREVLATSPAATQWRAVFTADDDTVHRLPWHNERRQADRDADSENIRGLEQPDVWIESDCEEWAVHDYEGFHGIDPGEYPGTYPLALIAARLSELGDDSEAFAAWCGYSGEDGGSEDAMTRFMDAYRGEYASVGEYAEQFMEDIGDLSGLPGNLRFYFDFDALGRDMDINGDINSIETSGGRVYIFDPNA